MIYIFYVNLSVKIFNLKMNHGSGREKKKEEKIFTLFRHKIWHKLVQVNMIRDKLKKMNLKIEKKIIYWTGSVMIMNFDSSSPFKYPVRHSSVVGGVFCRILQGVSAFWDMSVGDVYICKFPLKTVFTAKLFLTGFFIELFPHSRCRSDFRWNGNEFR